MKYAGVFLLLFFPSTLVLSKDKSSVRRGKRKGKLGPSLHIETHGIINSRTGLLSWGLTT